MKYLVVIIVSLALSSCGSVTVRKEEALWQALHVADVAQTVQIAKSDCYYEDSSTTAKIVGRHPSDGRVMLWGVAISAAHFLLSDYFFKEEKSSKYKPSYTFWQLFTIVHKAETVYGNEKIGLGVDSRNC